MVHALYSKLGNPLGCETVERHLNAKWVIFILTPACLWRLSPRAEVGIVPTVRRSKPVDRKKRGKGEYANTDPTPSPSPPLHLAFIQPSERDYLPRRDMLTGFNVLPRKKVRTCRRDTSTREQSGRRAIYLNGSPFLTSIFCCRSAHSTRAPVWTQKRIKLLVLRWIFLTGRGLGVPLPSRRLLRSQVGSAIVLEK